jgi:hypothetical protein
VIGALVFVAWTRFLRTPRAWLAALAWWAIALAVAVLSHREGILHGADRSLLGTYGGLALPLLSYSIAGGVWGVGGVARSIAPVVALGAPPAWAAAATIAVCGAACAIQGALLGATVAVIAHGLSDPPRIHDGLVTAYVGGLGGLAYAGWFSLGASFGRRGGGRTAALVINWALGPWAESTAVVTPLGHVQNMLGGVPPLGISERASAIALLAMAGVFGWAAAMRARSAPRSIGDRRRSVI